MRTSERLRAVAICDGRDAESFRDLTRSTVRAGDLLAVLPPGDEEDGAPADSESLRAIRHLRLVENLAARVPVIPLRYGTEFESAEHLRRTLETRAGEIRQRLGELAGAVEMSVRRPPAPSDSMAEEPSSWLRRRAEEYRQNDDDKAFLEDLVIGLGGIARDHRLETTRVGSGPRTSKTWVLRLLVDRSRMSEVLRVLEDSSMENVIVLGPSAPWSFASLEAETGPRQQFPSPIPMLPRGDVGNTHPSTRREAASGGIVPPA